MSKEKHIEYLVSKEGYSLEAAEAICLFADTGLTPVSYADWYTRNISTIAKSLLVVNVYHSLYCAMSGVNIAGNHWEYLHGRLQLFIEASAKGW